MKPYIAIVGLDEIEAQEIAEQVNAPVVTHLVLPKIAVQDGTLWMESGRGGRYVPVSKVVYHAIYEDDLNFIGGLALWGGACLPNARGMMDARLKLPCLVRALQYTRFPTVGRGYAAPGARFESEIERVAKWGDWHCGENKERFTGAWSSDQPAIIEPFLIGESVRVVAIGDHAWQIRLEGDDWLKSIHHDSASFMEIDPELLDDTLAVRAGFGLELAANDYLVTQAGTKHLLEMNHIPNVTRFPEIWRAYRDFVVNWLNEETL
jgi:hypothetical protein